MDLLWPGFLLLLGLAPLMVAGYVWMLRLRRPFAVRYSSLALVRQALPQRSRLRRHLPFALFVLALASLVVALGRPVAPVRVPAGRPIVILAMDVSLSMCSTDIPPSRLQAAQAAALSFIRRHSPEAQIGIVAFAGSAELVQPPTTDQAALFSAVDSLTTAPATAIGSGILRSLDAIAEVNRTVAPGAEPAPAPGGVIVLLTDGESTTGPMPLRVAQQAVERGVRVHTIGFGTPDNQSITNCSAQIPEGLLDGGGQARLWHGLGIDEPMLRQIADMTGGTYYPAASQGELQNVFQNLPTYAGTRQETTEISVAFAALGALLAALAMLLALIWQPLG